MMPCPASPLKMEKQRSHMTDRILNLTLEIIYLLTGENYIAFKLSDGVVGHNLKTLGPLLQPPPPPPSPEPEEKGDKKYLEVTNKLVELLTGEVPIRCQDVAVYLSMEEREYLEGHCDQYKAAMMEEEPRLTSPDGSVGRNSPEGSSHPLYSQDSAHEEQTDRCIKISSSEKPPCLRRSKEDDGQAEFFIASRTGKMSDVVKAEPKQEDVPLEVSADNMDHNLQNRSPSEDPPYSCSLCGKGFTKRCNLTNHRRTHTGEKPYLCSICGKTFRNKSNLGSHQRMHDFIQSISGQISLDAQQRPASGARPYPCSVCGKRFIQKSHLVTHRRIHTGEKPFSCSTCGKSFTDKSNLVSHLRTHTGPKPYHCSGCGKSFAKKSLHKDCSGAESKGALKMEEENIPVIKEEQSVGRTRAGSKPYHCSSCGKSFARKSLHKCDPPDCSGAESKGALKTEAENIPVIKDEQSVGRNNPPELGAYGPTIKNPAQSCLPALYVPDSTPEDPVTLYHYQGENLTAVKDEYKKPKEPCVEADNPSRGEAIPPEISTDEGFIKDNLEKPPDICGEIKDNKVTSDPLKEDPGALDLHPVTQNATAPAPPTHGWYYSDHHHPVREAPWLDTMPSSYELNKYFTPGSELLSRHRSQNFPETFSYAEFGNSLTHKLEEKIISRPHQCSVCGKCFTQRSHLVTHIRIHTGEKPFSCATCGKSFTDKSNLANHLKTHGGKPSLPPKPRPKVVCKGQRVHPCSICGKQFTQKSHLITHRRIHTGEKPFSCPDCDKRFSDKSNLITHQRSHTGTKPYLCHRCGKCFTRKNMQKEHKCDAPDWTSDANNNTGNKDVTEPYMTGDEKPPEINADYSGKTNPADRCSPNFTQEHYSMAHNYLGFITIGHSQGKIEQQDENINEEPPLEISLDGRYIGCNPELDPHAFEEVEADVGVPAESSGESIDPSDYLPLNLSSYRGHVTGLSHSENPPASWREASAPCYDLNDYIAQSSALQPQPQPRKACESFSCLECGKCFALKANLERHEKIHSNDRPHPCPMCSKRFTQKSHLMKHKRIHTGEKPFSCSVCGKCFTDKSNLTYHQRTHTGLKPFSCPDCGKCFARRTYQRAHKCDRR